MSVRLTLVLLPRLIHVSRISPSSVAAVDRQNGAGNIGRSCRSEINDGGRDLRRFADAAHRCYVEPGIKQLRPFTHFQGHVGRNVAGRQCVRVMRGKGGPGKSTGSMSWSRLSFARARMRAAGYAVIGNRYVSRAVLKNRSAFSLALKGAASRLNAFHITP
jgi:hypothetical protein